ncbi:hypothetical protein ACROYT_G006977 [Oculina patagonica]
MKTSVLLFVFASVILILLSFPEESHGVIFVLTHGKVRNLQRKGHDRKLKRRQKARRNKNRKRKQRQLERKKVKALKRWLERFSKKDKNSDHGDRGFKTKPIW